MAGKNKQWGITKIKTVDFTYTWTIHNFSFNNKKINEYLCSPSFQIPDKQDYKWFLSLYPKGQKDATKDSKNSVTLYLHLRAVNPNISTKITFSILDGKKKDTNIENREFIYNKATGYGILSFIKQNTLFDPVNNLLPNDTLTIVCKVTAGAETEVFCRDTVKFEEYRNKFTVISDLKLLLENKHLTDVTLIAEGKELQAHKIILAARSPVFLAMLQTDMQEKKNSRIDVDDVSYNVLSKMLQYLYTGEVKDMKECATDLLRVADKYDIKGLKLACEEQLYSELTIDNAIKLFILADRHNCDVFRPLILKFIVAHAKDVVKSVEFKKCEKDLPILIKEMIYAVV